MWKDQVCVECLWNALEIISVTVARLWRCSGRSWAWVPRGQFPLEGLAEAQELVRRRKCQLKGCISSVSCSPLTFLLAKAPPEALTGSSLREEAP